ncbi:MAG: succinate dehydrogenase, hydrophobic membrane anchor protein [Gammaproteobacteria bacterium]|nr:succinate dehydrogenase, hydrophobic membrane anchor protein [Gammaproteobacteria bacterium]
MNMRAGGIRPWVVQRVSASFMLFYIIAFFVALLLNAPLDAQSWRAWYQNPLVNVATMLFWVALLLHAWVGVRDVIMDYVSHTGMRFLSLAFAATYLAAMGLWVFRVLILVSA